MLKIQALRKRAEMALGKQFNIREFHDVVLQDGSVSLPILESNIDLWITTLQN